MCVAIEWYKKYGVNYDVCSPWICSDKGFIHQDGTCLANVSHTLPSCSIDFICKDLIIFGQVLDVKKIFVCVNVKLCISSDTDSNRIDQTTRKGMKLLT